MNALQPSSDVDEQNIYDRKFWFAYLANVVLVAANSLTFRFAEFVAFLGKISGEAEIDGGTERLSGQIVSTGLILAVCFRFVLGPAIDRWGTRHVWMLASLVYIAGCLALLIPQQLSVTLWLARIAYQVGLAGMFTCSIVHIQNQVPANRRTEVIGVLGSSGFVGTILGTQLGDLIFLLIPEGMVRFCALFGGSSILGFVHLAIVFFLTRHDVHDRPAEIPSAHRLLFRYWPGVIFLAALAMGTNFAVTTVFLTRFATQNNLRGIGTFFLAYSVTAFCCRWLTREWGSTIGRHRMVLWGLAGITCGQLLFLFVTSEWIFVFPALFCGFGHSLLFPAVVSLGAGRFPVHYRGSGTTLVLGFQELGIILSAPVLGAIIDSYDDRGYPQMFVAAAAVSFVVGIIYACTAARHPDRDLTDENRTAAAQAAEEVSIADSAPV